MFIRALFLSLLLSLSSLHALTLSEMKESLESQPKTEEQPQSLRLNDEMAEIRNELREISELSQSLYLRGESSEEEFESLLTRSQQLKSELKQKEHDFRTLMQSEGADEPYSLMHEKEVSLERLITEYASSNYLYVIPPEMAKIQLHLCSNLAIPKASWQDIIEIICLQNGIGVKEVNSYVKTLYWTLGNHSNALKHILNHKEQLELITPHEQVCFIFSLSGSEINRVHQFLKRFINERFTSIHTLGSHLLLIGEAGEVKELAKLVEFINTEETGRSYRLIQLDNICEKEAQAILETAFQEAKGDAKTAASSLSVLPVKGHLLLMGTDGDLEKSTKMLEDISSQISSPDQMTLYWYTCRYSDPQDLAALLQQVYEVMATGATSEPETPPAGAPLPANPFSQREGTLPPICDAPPLVVNPKSPAPPSDLPPAQSFPNFIVDGKTGLIVMVVKQVHLEKLKELAKKLDVPKKMVEIEVLLFEKKILDQTQFGLNLLKLGDSVQKNDSGMSWNVSTKDRSAPGILDYFFARKHPGGSFPGFNFAYNFLSSQEDICIHSNPTITTINQTQAVIDLVEEQSINMGTVEDPRTSVISNTFVRAQYGIIIQITPTINYGSEDNDFAHFVTLETDIIFDTTTSDKNNRPDISRRHIQNQVRIADGQTLILGGLRRKNTETQVDKIPFIGDIPGLGKLFSYTSFDDKSTEMFILITPRIVEDAMARASEMRRIDLKKRPGDSDELLRKLMEAKEICRQKQVESNINKLLTYGKA